MLPSSSTAAWSVSSETVSVSRSAAAAVAAATFSTFLVAAMEAAVTSGFVSNGVEEHTGPRYLTHWL
uniref:Uncharacterized protein n=1 Tax=Oryza nivara TaxID=4536 RepID=A0A0E0HAS5_ORYNI